MQGETITVREIMNMDLPAIIVFAIPVMMALVLLEYVVGIYQKRELYEGKDFWASLGIGAGNILSSTLFKGALFGTVLFVYNLMPWKIPHTWWSYVGCFIVLDFCRYWAHRIAHEQRFWWATHVPHHSSEQYNFSVTFRLSWVQHIKVIFFLPVALLGFDPFVYFICHQIAVLYQFWIHTELIDKMWAPIEYIFVTPSHHRVHHGRDAHYLDKNYGSTFIIWDRIFGTFQKELETPDYGITQPPNSYNPVYLVFHEFIDIAKDLKNAGSLKEVYYILFDGPDQARRKELLKQQEQHEQQEVGANLNAAAVPVENE